MHLAFFTNVITDWVKETSINSQINALNND